MNSKRPIREKRHRLPKECYQGMIRVNFTGDIKDGLPAFVDDEIYAGMVDCLRRALKKHRAKNWVYIFMPEHMHCILEGETEETNLLHAMYCFKQQSGLWLARHRPAAKWQKDFYDHIHGKDEDLQKHIGYILENPVRRKLVDDWRKYPYLGSLDFRLEDICW